MSTRSIIIVTGQDCHEKNKTVRLYKHSDGYPAGALSVIEEAIKSVQAHKYEPSYGPDKGKSRINVMTLVGKLIGAGTSKYGMGVVIDGDGKYNESFKPEHLGIQGDLEWVYIIDLNKLTVSILGGGYTGKTPDTFKLADPFAYANCLREEFRAETIAETTRLIRFITAWGFKVLMNKSKSPKRALKAVSNE
jgi:hypothetical protein